MGGDCMYIYRETSGIKICSSVKVYKKGISKLHWHDNLELAQLVSDTICGFLVNGEIVSAKKGDIVVFPEKSLHRFYIENDAVRVRIIQFPIKIIIASRHSVGGIKPHIKAEEIEKIPHLKQNIDYLCGVADNEYEENEEGGIVLESVLSALYFLLARYFPAESNSGIDRSERSLVYKVAKYINDNYKSDINVKKIAEEFHRSRGRMSEAFKKYAGVSISEYINELRIKNAIKLLQEGARIGEVAFESGFQSLRSFNGIFKKYMGVTPSEYIKASKK